jgi:putative oxidoreductase
MGFMFISSSTGKIKNVKGFSEQNEISKGLAYIVLTLEFTAGVGLVLGLFTRIAALIVMGLMTGTMYKHIVKWKSPYWASEGGWEYDLIWFIMAVTILLIGGGKIALYHF